MTNVMPASFATFTFVTSANAAAATTAVAIAPLADSGTSQPKDPESSGTLPPKDPESDWNSVEAEAAEKECCICLKAEEVGKLLALVPYGHRCVCDECSALVVGRTCPVPNGGQTGDPCLRLTFPRTGLAGEDGVGRSIIFLQFRPNLNYGLQVHLRIYTLIIRKYQYIPHPFKADSFPSQIALLFLNWSVIRQGLWLKSSVSIK